MIDRPWKLLIPHNKPCDFDGFSHHKSQAIGRITGVNADSDQFHVDFKEAPKEVSIVMEIYPKMNGWFIIMWLKHVKTIINHRFGNVL